MRKHLVTIVNALCSCVVLMAPVHSQTQQSSPAKAQAAPTPRARQSSAAKSQGLLSLKTQNDKFSYALGMNLGTTLHAVNCCRPEHRAARLKRCLGRW